MKRVVLILCVPAIFFAGRGTAMAASTSFCQSVSTVKADIATVRGLRANPTLRTVTAAVRKLARDVRLAIANAKGAAGPQVKVLRSSVQSLKATLTQVRDRKVKLRKAVPTLKAQAKTVKKAWQGVTSALKC
jgi:hypothetical protein